MFSILIKPIIPISSYFTYFEARKRSDHQFPSRVMQFSHNARYHIYDSFFRLVLINLNGFLNLLSVLAKRQVEMPPLIRQ